MFDFLKKFNKKTTLNGSSLRHSIKQNKSLFDEIATLKNAQGFINIMDRLPNPDIILKNAGKTISVLSRLEHHYQVGACIESRKAGTLRNEWELSENNCPKSVFEVFKNIFNIIDIQKLMEDILDAPMYGYNPIEIIWQKDGNYIIPMKLEAKPQEWFYFNSEGKFFFKNKYLNDRQEIDLNGVKFLLPRNKPKYQNPYGLAKLSSAFWNVVFINGGMEMWVKFSEKYAMPYMFGKYDRSMTKKEQNEFLTGLSNLVQDAIALIPSDGSVEIMQTGGSANSAIYQDLITKCENNISKAILGQTLTTDIGSSGSYAASNTHMEVREDIVQSDMKLVENTINHLIKFINRVNFNSAEIPIFKFKTQEDLGTLKAERDNKIASLGVRFNKSYLIRTYGYLEEDFEILKPALESGLEDFSQNKESITEINNEFNFDKLDNPMKENIDKIIDFFNKTRDCDETIEKIGELYPKLNYEQLEEVLTKIIFIAEMKGRADTQAENEEFSAEYNDGDVGTQAKSSTTGAKGRLDCQIK